MADDLRTFADNVADALDLSGAEVSEILNDAPVLARLPMVEPSNGETHKYNKYTGAPVVGFRSANAGRDFDHSIDTVVTVTLKICDFSFAVDKAVADAWRRGGAQSLIRKEAVRHIGAALFKIEQQIFQGTGLDAAGFSGLPDSTYLDAAADAMVIDAGGTTASTGSSCYLMRVGEDEVAAVGEMPDVGETIVQDIVDGSSQHYPAYYTPGCVMAAVQQGGQYSIARIASLTEDASADLDDELIYQAASLFPAGRGPNMIVCSRRSLRQLRASRTATNVTGSPAPIPTEVPGIGPIIATDAIPDTETLL